MWPMIQQDDPCAQVEPLVRAAQRHDSNLSGTPHAAIALNNAETSMALGHRYYEAFSADAGVLYQGAISSRAIR